MIVTVEEFETQLNRLDPDDNAFVLRIDELIGDLAPAIADQVYLAILHFFERHPNADCGSPGTLVHHVEEFYPNYVDALIESVSRRASYNGALMVNRILNTDIDPRLRSRLMDALNAIVKGDEQVSAQVLETVRGFIERQTLGPRIRRST